MTNEFDSSMKHMLENASQLLSAFPNALTQEKEMEVVGKLLRSDNFAMVWDCILMIEKYHYTVFVKDGNAITSFQKEDMKAWNNIFYPNLVKTNLIHDTSFFDPQEKNPNIGVGVDGAFTRVEYINLRYQLYAYVYHGYQSLKGIKEMLLRSPLDVSLHNVIGMLNPYIAKFNVKNPKELFTLQGDDMKAWKQHYFPVLVETSFLNDYTIMDATSLRKNFGIGDDGIGFCWELQYVVSEAYRSILLPFYLSFLYPLP